MVRPHSTYSNPNKEESRWKRMLKENDSKSLWRGINWNGEFRESDSHNRPSEVAFQTHMEILLNP